MQVIPAIDLRGGLCVRLRQGDYDQETVFGDDPAAMAARWESEGAARIHLVDLDGAKAGRPVNVEAVRRIVERVAVPCQLGGGVRDEATIAAWLDAGLERVIVGTQALRDPDWFRAMVRGVSRAGWSWGSMRATGGSPPQGWLETSTRRRRRRWPRSSTTCRSPAIIYTDIARDGTLEGPNLEATAALAERRADPGDRLRRRRHAGRPRAAGGAADRRLHRRPGPVRRAVHAARRPSAGLASCPRRHRRQPSRHARRHDASHRRTFAADSFPAAQPPIGRRRHDHDLSHRRYPQRRPGWTWGVGQDQPCRRPALRRRCHRLARARSTTAPAPSTSTTRRSAGTSPSTATSATSPGTASRST